ncbi:tetratricopeptide repeat-containing serine/threonine-protein kinase [Planctomycetota bacterium]
MSTAGDDEDIQLFQPWYPGKVIEGLYRIEEEIARGGMGVVHKATDLTTNDFVVIKSLLPEIAKIDEYKKRFIREAEEWVRLGTNPHIVRAFTAHEIDYLPRLVLEYVEGGSLLDMLEKGMPTLDRALDIAIQICWGMAYAHDKELTHRDLKPGNIMVSDDGVVKVTDFGLVKRMFEKGETLLAEGNELPPLQTLMTQGILGTPEYMAPEQWHGSASQTLDIYAFGIILYEMFCGSRPFDFSNLQGMKRITAYQTAHCQEPPPEPVLIRNDLPAAIGSLVLRCLAKDPEQRPKTFRHVAKKIGSFAKQITGESFHREPSTEELNHQGKLDQANGYLRLGKGCSFRGDYDKAMGLYDQAFAIYKALNHLNGMSIYYIHTGEIYWCQGENERAMERYQESLEISKRLGQQNNISRIYNCIAIIYSDQGHYQRAMELYQKSLDISESLEDQKGAGQCLLNIGNILCYQGDYDQAMAMYQKSLEGAELLKLPSRISMCCHNMGVILTNQGAYEQAVEKYQRSLEVAEYLEDHKGISQCNIVLGVVLEAQGKHDEAMNKYQQSLEISKRLGDQKSISHIYQNMGSIFRKQDNLVKAMDITQQSLEISQHLGDQIGTSQCYLNMGTIFENQAEYNQAMETFQMSLKIAQSLQHKKLTSLALFGMGRVYSAQALNAKALEHLNQSLEIMKEIKRPDLGEVEKLIAEIKEQSNKE